MSIRLLFAFGLAAPLMVHAAEPVPAAPAGHITGIGGIFLKANDQKALVAWYRDVLGLPLQAWGGAAFRPDAPGHPPAMVWNVLPASTKYLAPSTSEFMINYAVDDMDALIARLAAKGVPVLKRSDDATGRFAWLLDPEGNKIELWQPKATASP
jgi:predicted enzyme related to lactoylglutathione lyase